MSARDDFRRKLAAHWASQNVDVVLSPVGPTPAPKHGTAKYWNVSPRVVAREEERDG